MTNPTELQNKLQDSLTKLRDEYEATHDELVQAVGYALDNIKYPSPPTAVVPDKPVETKKASGFETPTKSTL